MVKITQGVPGEPIYIAAAEMKPGIVAKTVQVIPCELMVDLGKKGELLGIEVLVPKHIREVPAILRKFRVPSQPLLSVLVRGAAPVRRATARARAGVSVARRAASRPARLRRER